MSIFGSISLIGKLAAITFTLPRVVETVIGPLLQIGVRIDLDLKNQATRLRTHSRSPFLSIGPERAQRSSIGRIELVGS
jgi:hypothetical protein